MPRIKQTKNKNQLRVITEVEKPCYYCEKPIEGGRSDKRFCDALCRMGYNNALKAAQNNLIRNINNALNKNRRILQSILSTGRAMSSKTELQKVGFNFDYHTHTRLNKNKGIYYYCYEYGYLILDKKILVVHSAQP